MQMAEIVTAMWQLSDTYYTDMFVSVLYVHYF
jgi:hypothetical protein